MTKSKCQMTNKSLNVKSLNYWDLMIDLDFGICHLTLI